MKTMLTVALASALGLTGLPALAQAGPLSDAQLKAALAVATSGNHFAAANTNLVVCTKSSYPGSVSCSAPVDLGHVYGNEELQAAYKQFSCVQTPGNSLYFCNAGGLFGAIYVFNFLNGAGASTIIYVPESNADNFTAQVNNLAGNQADSTEPTSVDAIGLIQSDSAEP
ncbi:hypothetical protein, partial [Chitinimonas sp.]|uniref:hypothetical protein n=1 Tax=Chitinimonas sp. TaxID=1934313 RepID=UPI0035ADCECD